MTTTTFGTGEPDADRTTPLRWPVVCTKQLATISNMITRLRFTTDFTDSAEKICDTLCADVASTDLPDVCALRRLRGGATKRPDPDQSQRFDARHLVRLRYSPARTIFDDYPDQVRHGPRNSHHAVCDEPHLAGR